MSKYQRETISLGTTNKGILSQIKTNK